MSDPLNKTSAKIIFFMKVSLTVGFFFSCHIRVKSNSTLRNCLNIKELCAWKTGVIFEISVTTTGFEATTNLVRQRTLLTIQPNWLNDWVFVYKLSSCGFESCCSYWKILCFDIDRYLLHLDLKKQKQRVEDLKLNRNSLKLNNYIFLI